MFGGNRNNQIRPYTWQGTLQVLIIRSICNIIGLWVGKKWLEPLPAFEENPRYMTLTQIIYLAYKYYYKSPEQFPQPSIQYFKHQNLHFPVPPDFVAHQEITLSAGGDLMPYRLLTKQSTKILWDRVGPLYFNADIVYANLETPIDTHRQPGYVPEVMLKDMYFNGSAELFDVFNGNGLYKGLDIVSTANNHSLDQGVKGVGATIDFLEKVGVLQSGMARSPQEKWKIPIVEAKGIRVAFISFTYCLNQLDLPPGEGFWVNHLRLNLAGIEINEIKAMVDAAYAQGADFTVLCLHAGNAYQPLPCQELIDTFHKIFDDAGPDVILGNHAHNPQPMEKYPFRCPRSGAHKQGFAVYALGDFVADDIYTWSRLSILLRLQITKGQDAQGRLLCLLTKVEWTPVYNYKRKDAAGNWHFQLQPFEEVLKNKPSYPIVIQQEITELERFYKEFWASYSHPTV